MEPGAPRARPNTVANSTRWAQWRDPPARSVLADGASAERQSREMGTMEPVEPHPPEDASVSEHVGVQPPARPPVEESTPPPVVDATIMDVPTA